MLTLQNMLLQKFVKINRRFCLYE